MKGGVKNKMKAKNKKELKKIEEEFVSFGNKKKVFLSITFSTIILSLIGIPLMIQDESFLKRFLIIWILEIIYIGMWVRWGEKKKRK
jgi:NADH:ubiquinone oxidoreductase subunit 2 (subunit N)